MLEVAEHVPSAQQSTALCEAIVPGHTDLNGGV